MADSSVRFVATAILALLILIVGSVALLVATVAVRLTLGLHSAWSPVVVAAGTFVLTAVGVWWVVGRMVRRG